MKKTKKQLLGLAGLAVVGIMTAVAASLPAPDAAAIEEGQTTKVQVMVGEQNPAGVFTSPSNNSATTKSIIPVVLNVSQVVKVEFRLIRYTPIARPTTRARVSAPTGTPETMDEFLYECPDITTATATCSFDFDTDEWGGLGEYVIRAIITDASGVTYEVDTVAFSYLAAVAEYKGIDAIRDPIIGGSADTSLVDYLTIAVFHRDGSELKDKDGKAMFIKTDKTKLDAEGNFLVTLPFKKYGAKSGDYTVVVTAYDDANNVLTISGPINFDYSPTAPETPNTGMLSASKLNISRIDYIITGLIAFALAAGFAIVMVCRKSRR